MITDISTARAYLAAQAPALDAHAGSPKARFYILSNAISTNLAMYQQALTNGYGIKYAEQRIIESADSWLSAMENEVKLAEWGW